MYKLALLVATMFSCVVSSAQMHTIDSLTKTLTTTIADTSKGRILLKIATQWSKQDPDSASFYAVRASTIFKNEKYAQGTADVQLLLGRIKVNKNDAFSALQHYKLALSIYTNLRDEAGQAAVYSGMGVAYGIQEKYPLALTNLLQALKIYEKQRNIVGASNTYMKIGVLHTKTNDLKAAMSSYQKALSLADKTNDIISQAGIRVNIGSLYGQMRMLDKSLQSLLIAKQLATQGHMLPIAAEAEMNLGNVYRELEQFDSAHYYFDEAEVKFKQLQNAESLARTYNALAELFFVTKNYSEAKLNADKSIAIATDIQNTYLLYNNYDLLTAIAKAEKNYSLLPKYYDQLLTLKDSLYNAKKNEQLERIKVEFQQEKDEQTIEQLRRENEVKTKQRNFLIIAFAVTGMLLLLLVVSLWMIYQKNLQLKKRRQELVEMNIMKDKFLSVISHDMRSPLASIVQIMNVVTLDEPGEVDTKLLFSKLIISTNSVLETMDNMLQWGKNYFTKGVVEKKHVNLQEIADRVCRFLKQSADNKDIHIQNHILEPIQVVADENQLEFVMRNLVSNAVKFSHTSSRIELSARRSNGSINISVKDYGTGMHEKQQLQLFDVNKRETKKGTAGETGAGIGLYLSQEFISLHNGSLQVQSEQGKGTEFIVTLPN